MFSESSESRTIVKIWLMSYPSFHSNQAGNKCLSTNVKTFYNKLNTALFFDRPKSIWKTKHKAKHIDFVFCCIIFVPQGCRFDSSWSVFEIYNVCYLTDIILAPMSCWKFYMSCAFNGEFMVVLKANIGGEKGKLKLQQGPTDAEQKLLLRSRLYSGNGNRGE